MFIPQGGRELRSRSKTAATAFSRGLDMRRRLPAIEDDPGIGSRIFGYYCDAVCYGVLKSRLTLASSREYRRFNSAL